MNTPIGHMDIKTIRRENARRIAKEVGGPAELARKLDMPNSGISQIIGKNPRRNIGDSTARRIEDAGGYHHGWLDTLHGGEQPETARTPSGVNVELLVDALIRSQKEMKLLSLNLSDTERMELLAKTAAAVYAYTESTGGTTLVDPSYALRLLLPKES
ncbi:hypothetical protein [Microbulbifer sp. VAAF005]|uniref:hypothetical protein n=1 Tax=Microbulbifer sp. VAAF005 TaxID=3034230 RepID=UPI0024ADF6B7|nr:hypothetical protein [Microbulbifer sp. VAAF005]WHI46565.1 hypothetical protein P0078_23140 [Microbulbifer sp. VAAF005]